MGQQSIGERPTSSDHERRTTIHAAAIDVFSTHGFSGTSMSDIAAAAGMSRPALYQYFKNKGDIFASAFIALLDDRADVALAELDRGRPVAECIDGFLQRFEGDLWEAMSASKYADEITSAKAEHAADGASAVLARLRQGLRDWLASVSTAEGADLDAWLELLALSPRGFKLDEPSVVTFRARLTTLARTVAADIERRSAAT